MALSRDSSPVMPPALAIGAPQQAGHGPGDHRTEHQHRDEDHERSRAGVVDHVVGLGQHRPQQHADAHDGEHHADDRAPGAGHLGFERRRPQCLDRPHTAAPTSRDDRGAQGDDHPDDDGDHDAGRLDGEAAGRQRQTERVERCLQQRSNADATEQADDGREHTDHQRLDHRGLQHLAPSRTDGAHEGRLPAPLGDDDREGVVDAERRHEQRDPGEHHEEGGDESEEVGVDVGDGLVGRGRTRERLVARTDDRLDPLQQLFLGDTPLRCHGDLVDLSRFTGEVRCGARFGEERVRDADLARPVTELGDADDRHLEGRRHEQRRSAVQLQLACLDRLVVEDDLFGTVGGATLDEVVRVEAVVGVPVGGQRRRAAATDALAVGPDDLGEARGLGGDRTDSVDVADRVGQQCVDRLGAEAGVVVTAIGRTLRANNDIDAGVPGLEQLVEVVPERVAEDERARQEADADQHREEGADEPPFVRPGVLE